LKIAVQEEYRSGSGPTLSFLAGFGSAKNDYGYALQHIDPTQPDSKKMNHYDGRGAAKNKNFLD
jgi:hypothetical protein